MRVHIVQKGDTLWKIAKQYAIGFEELKRLNAHLANPDYIVPGMEIYLPDSAQKKETKHVVKEQPKPVKEQPIQGPAPMPAPAPAPTPVPMPMPQPQKPIWQGDIYFQQPQQPMPMPNWQTHVQPSFENTVAPPQPQPVPMPPMMPQQPIIIQQPPQQPMPMPMPQMPVCHSCQQRMLMESAMPMQHHMHMHQPMPMQLPMHMDQPMPMPIQSNLQEESSLKASHCPDKDQLVCQYYEEIDHMMRQQYPCCPPQMMPYPANMMPQMQPMPYSPKSCH